MLQYFLNISINIIMDCHKGNPTGGWLILLLLSVETLTIL